MGEHSSHLILAEWRVIDEMFQASIPVREIAARLGWHRGTIHREINRNFYHTHFRDRFGNDYQVYCCMSANKMASRQRGSAFSGRDVPDTGAPAPCPHMPGEA